MNKLKLVIIIMTIFSFSNVFGASPEQKFWKWFESHEGMLFDFERDRENIFDELSVEMNKVNPDLTFEFGPVNGNGKREFVISAGGIKKSFPSVELLFSTSPNLDRWEFIKYRPRRSPLNDLDYGGKSIASKDVDFKMFKDGEKVGIVLFLDGYNEKEHDTYGNLGYLFLDEALGEYDMETKVGFIEFHGRASKYFEGSRPLSELADDFDYYFNSKSE